MTQLGEGVQGLDAHRVRGVLLFARWPSIGGCGSPPRGLRYLREEGRESGAAVGHGVHFGGGGLWVGGWVRARGGRGCGELSRRASPCGRPGGGAAGAGQSRPGSPGRSRCRRGRGQRWGPHPARRGRITPSIIHGGESWWRRGGAPRSPLAAEPDRDGPRRRDTGGADGAGLRGSGAPVPGGCGPARGRPGGHFWFQNGPFLSHFGIFHGPKRVTTSSKRAKNTCLSIPSGLGTTS